MCLSIHQKSESATNLYSTLCLLEKTGKHINLMVSKGRLVCSENLNSRMKFLLPVYLVFKRHSLQFIKFSTILKCYNILQFDHRNYQNLLCTVLKTSCCQVWLLNKYLKMERSGFMSCLKTCMDETLGWEGQCAEDDETKYHKLGKLGVWKPQILVVSVLEARNLKSWHQQGWFLRWVLRSFCYALSSYWWQPAILCTPGFSPATSLQCLPPLLCGVCPVHGICVCTSFPFL